MVRQEKEAYQLMAEQLREKFQAQRRKYEERERVRNGIKIVLNRGQNSRTERLAKF